MDSAYTVVVLGDVVAVAVVVGGAEVGGVSVGDAGSVIGGVEGVVVVRRSEVRVELNGYIQEQAGGSGPFGFGPVVKL